MSDPFSFILSSQFAGIVIYLKPIFIILALIFLASIVILLLKNTWLKFRFLESWTEFFIYRPFGVKKTFKQWAKISKRLETNREAEYKLAIIEADSLLNDVLGKMGIKGETIGEKLKEIDSATLPNIDKIWEAHKIRNNVVHDPDYRLTLDQAKIVLGAYEESFRSLEMF